jgi:hypothetical protein
VATVGTKRGPILALSRQPAKLAVDEQQKLLCRLGIALLDGRKDSGDVVHRMHPAFWGPTLTSILV